MPGALRVTREARRRSPSHHRGLRPRPTRAVGGGPRASVGPPAPIDRTNSTGTARSFPRGVLPTRPRDAHGDAVRSGFRSGRRRGSGRRSVRTCSNVSCTRTSESPATDRRLWRARESKQVGATGSRLVVEPSATTILIGVRSRWCKAEWVPISRCWPACVHRRRSRLRGVVCQSLSDTDAAGHVQPSTAGPSVPSQRDQPGSTRPLS